MRAPILTAALALFLSTPALAQSAPIETERDDVEMFAESDPEMNAAIANAQSTLDGFLTVLANPPEGAMGIAFKYPLGGWEHIWVTDVERDGEYLTGRLNNVPMQESWAQGDIVAVPISEVSDWAWMGSDGVMRGHHTTRVLLGRLDPQVAASIRRSFGWED